MTQQIIEKGVSEENIIYINFELKNTWTTDAIYRETKNRAKLRLSQGATAVEMECASFCAVAKAKNLVFSQILYFTDAIKQKSLSSSWNWIDERPNFDTIKLSLLKICIDFYLKQSIDNTFNNFLLF